MEARAENEADAAWPVENDDRAAVPVWNESLRCALDALAKVGAERMAVLAYETTFARARSQSARPLHEGNDPSVAYSQA